MMRFLKCSILVLAWTLDSRAVWPATDVTPPFLVTAQPPSGSTAVPTNQAIGFRFSEPMVSQISRPDVRFVVLVVPPVTLAWSHSWSPDKLTLTCRPVAAWPSASTISWVVGTNLFDLAGNRLVANALGTFRTASAGGIGGEGSGSHPVTTHSLSRMDAYEQDSPDPPRVATNTTSQFAATTTLASNRVASAISVATPAAGVLVLAQDPFAPEAWAYEETSLDPLVLDVRFPGGNHEFVLENGGASESTFVFLPSVRPAAPHVANWGAAQGIRADLDFVLEWHPWLGATAEDHIQVRVGDGVFESGAPGQPGALTGIQTNVIIPAGRLASTSRFDAWVTFLTRRSTVYPTIRVETLAERSASTAFALKTAPLASTPLILTNWNVTPDHFEFSVHGPAQQSITIASRPALAAGSWSAVLTTNLGSGSLRLSFARNPILQSGFYLTTSP